MGTRTDIQKVVNSLREFAARNPSVAQGLIPIVAELEMCAEKADRKRLSKKRAVEELLNVLPRTGPGPSAVPKANFVSTMVSPKITDAMLKHQLADYEKTLMAFIQQVERTNQSYASAINLFRGRWDK